MMLASTCGPFGLVYFPAYQYRVAESVRSRVVLVLGHYKVHIGQVLAFQVLNS